MFLALIYNRIGNVNDGASLISVLDLDQTDEASVHRQRRGVNKEYWFRKQQSVENCGKA